VPNKEEAAALRASLAELSSKADRVYAEFRTEILRRI
jgi:hypothetical protein